MPCSKDCRKLKNLYVVTEKGKRATTKPLETWAIKYTKTAIYFRDGSLSIRNHYWCVLASGRCQAFCFFVGLYKLTTNYYIWQMADSYKWYKVYDFKTHGAEPQELFSLRAIEADGKRLVLVRNAKGYYAVDDKCPHAGYPLSHGKCLQDGTLMCIYHRYRFDLETGQSGSDYVQTHPVRVDNEGVFIGLKKKKWWSLW